MMKRLTTDKPAKEMGMYELAHNCMFIKDGEAWFRDFDQEISLRNMIRLIIKEYTQEYDDQFDDDEFLDEILLENLQYPVGSGMDSFIAIFNMLAWSHAELRERLKHYEELEEKGKLLKLPCKPGDILYETQFNNRKWEISSFKVSWFEIMKSHGKRRIEIHFEETQGYALCDGNGNLDEGWYLTEQEAEEALKKEESN